MRKLTVKNFSVIKEAELEFGKITVLIGPQSSGKSLLCKLAYFLGWEVIRIAIDRATNFFEYSDFLIAVQDDFAKWFLPGGWGDENWSIIFVEGDFTIMISALSKSTQGSGVYVDCASFRSAYEEQLRETVERQKSHGFVIKPALESRAATKFLKLAGRGVWDTSTYIPEGRSYFVDTAKGYRILSSEADPITANFAATFANSLKPGNRWPRVSRFLQGDLLSGQAGWMLAFKDGRLLPLSQISSGSKETLPMLSVLDYYEHQRRKSGHLPSAELYGEKLYGFDDFTIEEPETSVFPQTQYDLIREISMLANETDFKTYFLITTHSPYILTSFNDLMKASQAAKEQPDRIAEIEMIIPRKYWIDDKDFKAYAFNGKDGILKDIMDEETHLIDGDILDSISDTIGGDFERLLSIQYADK